MRDKTANTGFSRVKTSEGNAERLIKCIPSRSARRFTCAGILNSLVAGRPECTGTVYALLTYSIQKWAFEIREELKEYTGIDYDDKFLYGEITLAADTLSEILVKTGITPRLKMTDRKRVSDSACVLEMIEKTVSDVESQPVLGPKYGNVLRAVHLIGGYGISHPYMDSDVSLYMVEQYYRDAVLSMHELSRGCFDCLAETPITESRRDNTARYHNTMLLLEIYPQLSWRFARAGISESFSDMKIQRSTNNLALLEILETAVSRLRFYPGEGQVFFKIISGIMEGRTDTHIKESLSLSTVSYADRKAKAVNLLSFILWGYTVGEIISGFMGGGPKLS